MNRRAVLSCGLLGILSAAAVGAMGQRATLKDFVCDRACLITMADQYFAGLVAHDPSKAPMAANAIYREMPPTVYIDVPQPVAQVPTAAVSPVKREPAIGEGLWKTVTEGPAGFKIYVPDPVSQEIGGILVIRSANQPMEIGFLLKVANGRITSADHVLAKISDAAALANLVKPRPELLAGVPPADRFSRESLISFAYSAYDSVSKSVRSVPHADDCVRRENGTPEAKAAQPGCGPQLTLSEITGIDSANALRSRLADPETGLVFNFSFTVVSPRGRQAGDTVYQGSSGLGGSRAATAAAHISKVQGNKVHSIEAVSAGGSQFTR